MLELAKEYNFLYIKIPDGFSSPRATIGYMIVSLLYSLYHFNLTGAAFIKETENAIEYIDRGEKAIQAEAELIAKKLKGSQRYARHSVGSGARRRCVAVGRRDTTMVSGEARGIGKSSAAYCRSTHWER